MRRTLALALTIFLISAASASATDFGDGAWCWFADPRAIEHKGHTYIGAVTSDGSITITDVDHAAMTRRTTVLYSRLQRDDHANPALQIRPDGRIVVYYSRHAGANLAYRVSTKPGDISRFEPARNLPSNTPGPYGFTYPNPAHLADEGRTFLFWRGGDFSAAYATQQDGTEAWSEAKALIKGDAASHTRPYVKYDTDGQGTIVAAFTNAHPNDHEGDDVNLYFVKIRDGKLERADGTEIGPLGAAISPADAELVDDRAENVWVSDVAIDSDGSPVVVYAAFPSPDDHRYWYVKWTGIAWEKHEIVAAGESIQPDSEDWPEVHEPYYSGGITLDHEDPSTVYLSRQVAPEAWQVETWVTADAGVSWSSTAVSAAAGKNVRPLSPRDAGTDVLWMRGQYNAYWSYGMVLASTFGTLKDITPSPSAPPASPPPAPPAAPIPATPAPPVVTPPPPRICTLGDRAIRRKGAISCARARRVLRGYIRRRHAPRGWRCRTGARLICRRAAVRVSVSRFARTS